jgi:hypothetical protein
MRYTNTFDFKGTELKITYNFYKGDRGVYRDSDGCGYPSTADDAEIVKIMLGQHDLSDLLEDFYPQITELILEEHE